MKRRINIFSTVDWWTVLLYFVLVFLGWISIYAAVYNPEHHSIFDFNMRYGKQLQWIITAIVIISIVFLFDGKFWEFFAFVVYGLVTLMLIAVLFFGKEINGARSWFEFLGLRIQPAEFAKFASSLAIAKLLSQHNFKIHKFSNIVKISSIIAFPAILILMQNDTGSALVYAAFVFVLFRQGLSAQFLLVGLASAVLFIVALKYELQYIYVSLSALAVIVFYLIRRNIKELGFVLSVLVLFSALLFASVYFLKLKIPSYLGFLAVVVVSSLIFIIFSYRKRIQYGIALVLVLISAMLYTSSVDYFFHNILEEHQQDRINVLLGIKSDPLGTGYNVNQSKIAIGSGGIYGKGFLQGTQTKFDFVPEQSTDFIFCTIGEEWGFAGSVLVIILYSVFLLRLIFLSERQKNIFTRIYGYCLVSILFFHYAINIGMTIGLAPVIGIPLPFFSYGGSSLWAFSIMLFVFIRLDAERSEQLF